MSEQKTLKQLLPTVKLQQQKLEKETKKLLLQEAKTLFDNFPDVKAIRWTQRRPLLNAEWAPFHKSDFCIDHIEYCMACRSGGIRDDDWISPWNDSRIESPDFLNSLTQFEEQLFDAEAGLATAIGNYDRVTITAKDVTLDEI